MESEVKSKIARRDQAKSVKNNDVAVDVVPSSKHLVVHWPPGKGACTRSAASEEEAGASSITVWLMPCNLWPNFMVLNVSEESPEERETHKMKIEWPSPFRKGCRIRVSFESRKFTWVEVFFFCFCFCF